MKWARIAADEMGSDLLLDLRYRCSREPYVLPPWFTRLYVGLDSPWTCTSFRRVPNSVRYVLVSRPECHAHKSVVENEAQDMFI